jgi:hypothetical protein
MMARRSGIGSGRRIELRSDGVRREKYYKMKKCLLFILISLLVCNCAPPSRNFKDSDLLINQSAMPANWTLVETDNSVENEGQKSGAFIAFQFEGTSYWDRGGEKIYRHSDSLTAAFRYKQFENDYFNDKSVYRTTPWQVPDGFEFSSSLAKQWRLACAGSNFGIPDSQIPDKLCIYLAQYDEFLVFFSITKEVNGESTITIEQVASIVKAIDEKMEIYLKP